MASSTNQAPIAPAKVLASAATGVVALIETNHGNVDTIFGHADIPTEEIESPFSELNLKQYCLLFEEADRQRQFRSPFRQSVPAQAIGRHRLRRDQFAHALSRVAQH